jgi:hypothetical protein
VIPANVELIKKHALVTPHLQKLTFEPGSNLKEIEDCAVSCHPDLKVEIPPKCEILHGNSVLTKNLTVSKEHPFFVFEDSFLMTRDRKTLIRYYGRAMHLIIKKEVEVLGNECFGYDDTREIEFEAGSMLREIQSRAFCMSLKKGVELPPRCEFVSGSVFVIRWRLRTLPRIPTISSENPFLVIDSEFMLMSTDGRRLIKCLPRGRALNGFTFLVKKECEVIGDHCFYRYGLDGVVFEEKPRLQRIGMRAFAECSLEKIRIPSSVEVLEESCFCGSALRFVTFEKQSRLKRIEDSCFESTKIRKIVIPSATEVIGDFVFRDCESLSGISFESGSRLQRIGSEAFRNTKFKKLRIPASCEFIGEGCFEECDVNGVTYEGDDRRSGRCVLA